VALSGVEGRESFDPVFAEPSLVDPFLAAESLEAPLLDASLPEVGVDSDPLLPAACLAPFRAPFFARLARASLRLSVR
jgi:hypothetical protein